MTHFDSLKLSPALLRALHDEGYTTPTPIQAQAIGPVLLGRDLLGCAQTGTGKTAAFALPILHRLTHAAADKTRRGPALPRVLVLSPTRELATQIAESFATYGKHTSIQHTVIFGGVSQFHQVKSLQRGTDILVATPGRLLDLMEQRVVDLSAIRILVLDEADRMLDMGFINPIRRIVAVLQRPPARQTLLFSATMPPAIMQLADSLLHDPVKVSVTPIASAAPLIEQSVYLVPRAKKPALLHHLLLDETISRALVFTRTKHGAERLAKQLNRTGVSADAIHGNKGQNQRTRALEGFRSGRSRVLVATDVAARGLDVDGVSHVFNFDLPVEPEAYVHRIGRTGRAGATGIAISFCDGEEHSLLRQIERLTGERVPAIRTLPPLPDVEPAPAERRHSSERSHATQQRSHGSSERHPGERSPRDRNRAPSNGDRPTRSPSTERHVRAPQPAETGRTAAAAHGQTESPRSAPPARSGHVQRSRGGAGRGRRRFGRSTSTRGSAR